MLVALIVCALFIGCRLDTPLQAPESPNDAAQRLCGDFGVPCFEDSQEAPTHGGAYVKWSQLEVEGQRMRIGAIMYDPHLCEMSVPACRFVLLHEIGHLRHGKDQHAADCFAMRWASEVEIGEGLAYLTSIGSHLRALTAPECPPI